jgi:hypothetical protein
VEDGARDVADAVSALIAESAGTLVADIARGIRDPACSRRRVENESCW